MLEKLGIGLTLAGIVIIVVFGVVFLIASALNSDDNEAITIGLGFGIAATGILILFVHVVRNRIKEKAEEDLEGIEP